MNPPSCGSRRICWRDAAKSSRGNGTLVNCAAGRIPSRFLAHHMARIGLRCCQQGGRGRSVAMGEPTYDLDCRGPYMPIRIACQKRQCARQDVPPSGQRPSVQRRAATRRSGSSSMPIKSVSKSGSRKRSAAMAANVSVGVYQALAHGRQSTPASIEQSPIRMLCATRDCKLVLWSQSRRYPALGKGPHWAVATATGDPSHD